MIDDVSYEEPCQWREHSDRYKTSHASQARQYQPSQQRCSDCGKPGYSTHKDLQYAVRGKTSSQHGKPSHFQCHYWSSRAWHRVITNLATRAVYDEDGNDVDVINVVEARSIIKVDGLVDSKPLKL